MIFLYMNKHENYMKRCLELAEMGAGTVSPNPMVGAVIVHQDRIIGEGYTSPYGGAHAEVNAIQQVIDTYGEEAESMLKAAEIYVSLEPCAHFGKTPPCANLLVKHQLQKVYIACLDPFAKVNGQGVKILQDGGLDVEIGILEEEAKWVNRRFFTKLSQFRPYVILKWAETADRYFAPLDAAQSWISNEASKQLVHKWRAEEDAILVGTATALIDNPSLTVRLWKGRNPKRILIDKNLDVPAEAHVLNDEAETFIFNAEKADWQASNKYIALENFDLYLPQQLLYQLYLMDIQSILIEGGVKTLQRFIDAGLWDEARVFQSPQTWGAGVPSPTFHGEQLQRIKVSTDTLTTYKRI